MVHKEHLVRSAWRAAILGLCITSTAGCSGVPLYEEVGSRGTDEDPASTTHDGATSVSSPVSSTGAATPGSTSGHDSTADVSTGAVETGPPISFDLLSVPDTPLPVIDYGCEEVDFLFVIDDSPGMGDAQAKLMASAPGFIESVAAQLEFVERFHVGVVTSDAYAGNGPECDALGDMVIHDGGVGGCLFDEGRRYATESDDLSAAFACMAQVGTSGSTLEQPVGATIAALDQSAQPGSCNQDFIGSKAVVVIVIVTDDVPSEEMDDANLESPDAPWWLGTLVTIVESRDAVIAMVGLVPWNDISCTGAQSPNLSGLVQSLDNGWTGWGTLASVCEPSYGPVFDEAVWSVRDACESFIENTCEVPGGC